MNEVYKPYYQTFKGWKKDISEIKEYKHLPKECKEYIEFIENWMKIPITKVSVGPDRNQTINR